MSKLRTAYELFKATYQEWSSDKTSQMAAALAFYGVFALAPLVIIAVAIAGSVFGQEAAQGEVQRQLHHAVGPTVAQAIEDTLQYSQTTSGSFVATTISIIVLVVGILSLFGQLQDSLNTIWGVKAKSGRGLWAAVRDRVASFILMIGVAVLLLASLVANSAVHVFHQYLHLVDLGGLGLWRTINWIVSFVLVTVLFAMVYKVLPDVKTSWKDVWVGAALTAVLFEIGNYLITLYLSRSGTASAYGAAGSIVILLLWVYYSSQVLLFGAEFTQVYANCFGEPVVAEEQAKLVDFRTQPRKKLAERCGQGPHRAPVSHGTAA
jgi:membrane protein